MAYRVKLRRNGFETRAWQKGLDTQTKQARAIGVHESIHSRALSGHREPNGPYVIGVLLLLGNASVRRQIRELFDVAEVAEVADDTTAKAS